MRLNTSLLEKCFDPTVLLLAEQLDVVSIVKILQLHFIRLSTLARLCLDATVKSVKEDEPSEENKILIENIQRSAVSFLALNAEFQSLMDRIVEAVSVETMLFKERIEFLHHNLSDQNPLIIKYLIHERRLLSLDMTTAEQTSLMSKSCFRKYTVPEAIGIVDHEFSVTQALITNMRYLTECQNVKKENRKENQLLSSQKYAFLRNLLTIAISEK